MSNAPRKPTILIVDDAAENLDVLKNVLVGEYMVRPCLNGPMALRLAAMEPQPDLIVLDIMMPGMDGFEVCRQLKNDPRTQNIPIIFVTAKTSDQDELQGLELGAGDYITKPFSPPIVKKRIKTQLALKNLYHEREENNLRLYEINEQLLDSQRRVAMEEDRFLSLVQTIPDIVYKIDSEGKFIFLNKSVERLGYHQSELIGRHFSEIIHNADIEQVSLKRILQKVGAGTINPAQKLFDERRSGERMTSSLELRLKTKAGKSAEIVEITTIDPPILRVEVNSAGLYGAAEPESTSPKRPYVGTVGVIRDITERQKAQKAFMEERLLLRQLLQTAPFPLFLIENEGKEMLANAAFQTIVEIEEETLNGDRVATFFSKEGRIPLEGLLSDLRNSPDRTRIQEPFKFKSRDGTSRVVEAILSKFQRSTQSQSTIIGILAESGIKEISNTQGTFQRGERL